MADQTGPGYTEDPYNTPSEKAEGFIIGRLVNGILEPVGFADPEGFCSTAREWHITLAGMYAGFQSPVLGNVPACPPLWSDEAQYYDTAAMFTNIIKCNWPAIAAFLGLKIAGIV